jgi:hypothetical protein
MEAANAHQVPLKTINHYCQTSERLRCCSADATRLHIDVSRFTDHKHWTEAQQSYLVSSYDTNKAATAGDVVTCRVRWWRPPAVSSGFQEVALNRIRETPNSILGMETEHRDVVSW